MEANANGCIGQGLLDGGNAGARVCLEDHGHHARHLQGVRGDGGVCVYMSAAVRVCVAPRCGLACKLAGPRAPPRTPLAVRVGSEGVAVCVCVCVCVCAGHILKSEIPPLTHDTNGNAQTPPAHSHTHTHSHSHTHTHYSHGALPSTSHSWSSPRCHSRN